MNLKLKYYTVTCAMVFTLCIAFERRAYAYVDPGSGLLLLQSLGAMFTAVLFFFRKHLKSLLTRSKGKETSSDGNVE